MTQSGHWLAKAQRGAAERCLVERGYAASSVLGSCGLSVSESATAFALTCADSRIAITLPLRMVQADATAAAKHSRIVVLAISHQR
jgi:hypothetical protein